jgi:hypothetical protein
MIPGTKLTFFSWLIQILTLIFSTFSVKMASFHPHLFVFILEQEINLDNVNQ